MTKIVWNRKVLGRLLSKLAIPEDKSGCWLWEGSVYSNGYGKFSIGNKIVYPHRVVYTIFIGEIPDRKLVCHSCDNRLCCNPTHLWAGTHEDNMLDMVKKNRAWYISLYREDNYNSKLTERDIPKIRRMLACSYSQRNIGKVFGVSKTTIGYIKQGKTWKQPKRFPRRD